MIWIFAAVVLILTVYHEGFRKFLAWCAMAAVLIFFSIACFVH
jgi:hypothetical protein